MVRALVLVVTIAGCSFHPNPATPGGDGGPIIDAGRDAADAADVPDAEDADAATCLDGWCRRKAITVHDNQIVDGPFADFVMLVRWDADPDLEADADPTGADLRFVASDGTPLPYEREAYDGGTGALTAWVHLPSLPVGGTTIYLYYGKPGAPDQQDPTATWAAGYADVLHLDEAPAAAVLADATGHGNRAVPMNGAKLGMPGAIGGAATLDGNDDYLRVQQSATLQATTGEATFALWLKWKSLTANRYQRILSSSNRFVGNGADDGYEWASQEGGAGDHYLYPWGHDSSDYNLGPTPFTAGSWQYAVATLDFASRDVEIYVNGTPMTFNVKNVPTLWTQLGSPGDWLWGNSIGPEAPLTGGFDGMMDEIQVMTGVRSLGWVETSYANQHAPSDFYAVGPAEVLSP